MNQKDAMIAGVIAGIGASLCCVAPLVFVSMGLGGAWLANLSLLEPVRPVFILLTLVFIGLAFRELYLVPKSCEPGICTDAEKLIKQRIVFWVITVFLLGLLAFPWLAPLFY